MPATYPLDSENIRLDQQDLTRLVTALNSTGGLTGSGPTGPTGPTGATGAAFASASAPTTATAAGTAGAIAYDSGFIYVCTATNTWKRVAIATF